MSKRIFTIMAAAAALIAIGNAYAAGDAAKEIETAGVHAQMASTVTDINMVHAHLHHVLNCLEGPGGKEFDATAENPCKDMGNGALPDLGDSPKVRKELEKAVKTAEKGLAATKFKKAHAAATKVDAILKHASKK